MVKAKFFHAFQDVLVFDSYSGLVMNFFDDVWSYEANEFG